MLFVHFRLPETVFCPQSVFMDGLTFLTSLTDDTAKNLLLKDKSHEILVLS